MSLRIAGGLARGRPLRVPPSGTRPTSERARAGLFNRLATLVDFDGASVLDLYAGSGAIGLEALSRGAKVAVLVDSDRRAVDVIRANARLVADDRSQVHVRSADVRAFLASSATDVPGAPFDVVFADPPYALDEGGAAVLLEALARPEWTAPSAVVVLERPARGEAPQWPERFEPLTPKKYGEAVLWYGRAR